MLTFKPLRLRDRIGIIVLLHAAMMVGVVVLFIMGTDATKIPPVYRLPMPEKVALVATAFEHTPPETHVDLARAFSDPTLRVSLLESLPQQAVGAATPEAFARYRQALGGAPSALKPRPNVLPPISRHIRCSRPMPSVSPWHCRMAMRSRSSRW